MSININVLFLHIWVRLSAASFSHYIWVHITEITHWHNVECQLINVERWRAPPDNCANIKSAQNKLNVIYEHWNLYILWRGEWKGSSKRWKFRYLSRGRKEYYRHGTLLCVSINHWLVGEWNGILKASYIKDSNLMVFGEWLTKEEREWCFNNNYNKNNKMCIK